jgi:hypothetical protein
MLRLERVRRSVGAGGLAAALVLLPLLLAGAPGNAHAQTDAFLINYYVNTLGKPALEDIGIPYDDQLVLTNDLPANVSAAAEAATLCANVYIFDTTQEMEECCACPLTPAQRSLFSVNFDLSDNSVANGGPIPNGVVHVVVTNSVLVTNPITGVPTVTCDATDDGGTNSPNSYVPTASMRGWITHSLNSNNPASEGEVEMALTGEPDSDYADAPSYATNNHSLASQCTVTQRTGADSGPRGVCTCPTPTEGN